MKRKFNFAIWTLVLFASLNAWGQNLVASLGILPVLSESEDKGVLVDFVKAMARVYPEGQIKFGLFPFERSVQNVLDGKADFHGPILKDPDSSPEKLGFAYSDANIWDVFFVLYTNRNNTHDVNVKNAEQFNIETDSSSSRFYSKFKPSACLECSLKKLNSGRIDGFVFAGLECDTLIKKFHLSNIKSVFYRRYEGKFVIPLGEKGKATNALLSQIVERTHRSGDFQKTIGTIDEYYKNWKPIP